MKLIIALILTAAFLQLIPPAEQNINNLSTQDKTKVQAVQAKAPRKESTDPTLYKSGIGFQEKALTDQPVVDKPEEVAVTSQPVKAVEPTPQLQGCEQYRPLVEQYDWDSRIALAIMQAESSCRPDALSPTADRGLMQINSVHIAKVNGDLNALYDPATNIRIGYSVYLSQGWKAWTVFNTGRYLAFL